MPTAWLTYSWKDNNDNDVDFIVQEIRKVGIDVKLDRWNIQAGVRLWDQISNFISNPSESDGWIMYATSNSLGSEPCKEEFSYALQRALSERGSTFPIIGLFPSHINNDLIPPSIKNRLYISLSDPDWKERIKASIERKTPTINLPNIDPFYYKVHNHYLNGKNLYVIEVRPRAGSWSPFIAAIPIEEKNDTNPYIQHGPSGIIQDGGVLHNYGFSNSHDGKMWLMYASDEATITQSYYIFCQKLPSMIIFGENRKNANQFVLKLNGC